ncbi:ATP-dependent helicase [Methanolobus sp. ZRKC3]|uniref:UvrD-helicase domain-containing protein n=1 Tax=Methanolobus sp. ZRKC3 TaxID=3125786 RepID=UPI0032551115
MTERIKILGPPGCGKTYAEIDMYRGFLLKGYVAEDITVTTFRKPSAEDLITKLQPYAIGKEIRDHVGTLHSICYRLLGRPEVITPKDILKFAKDYGYAPYMQNMTASSNSDDEEMAYSGQLIDLYIWMRNTRTPVEKWYLYPGAAKIQLPADRVPEFIEDYEHFKKTLGKIDFSDMIEHVLIEKIPLDTPILIVDEFQDLTRQQYELFKMWANGCEYVIIAGDPLQSIYGFWGGSPDYFNEWNAKMSILSQSYRLKTPIWNLTTEILRAEGQMVPEVETMADYGPGTITYVDYTQELPMHVGSELHLVRCNYQAQAIAMQLARQGYIFGGLCGWSESEVNLFNALLRVRTEAPLMGKDMKSLLDNYPAKYFRYTGRKTDFIESLKTDYVPTIAAMSKYIGDDLHTILNSDFPAYYIRSNNDLTKEKMNEAITRPCNQKLITADDLKMRRILTIHGAKGMEADTVYLHTGITPRIKEKILIPGEDSAAEARVWHVGVTRAKSKLYLITDRGYNYEMPWVVA